MKKNRQLGILFACLLLAGCKVDFQEPTAPAPPLSDLPSESSEGPIPEAAPIVIPEKVTEPEPEPEPKPAPQREYLSVMQDAPIKITVNPFITRNIGGIATLDRQVYFSLAEHGPKLEKRVKTPEMYDFLTHELKLRFGRQLGPVHRVDKWWNATREDPNRKGFVDLSYLRSRIEENRKEPGAQMLKDYGPHLHVAAHGHPMAYPSFMGRYTTEALKGAEIPQALPENLEASAEYAAAVFKYSFSDFDRPLYFEPINEPHWSFDQKILADWHMAMQRAFRKAGLPVKVGGPCSPVAYMFKEDYRIWESFSDFMDNTQGKMDFYSFHVYDFLQWQDEEFRGRIQTGLPVEGTLDMIPNYGLNKFNREMPMVISEHGGYLVDKTGISPEELEDQLAKRYFPGEGFDWVMKKRAIHNYQHVHSLVNNTLAFMDHPHTLKKAVPFILLDSFDWDPEYYATLYVGRNFSDKKDWVESANMDFYRLFRDLEGRRVYVNNTDPDLQVQAFAIESTLRVVINNLHAEGAALQLELPDAASYSLRRYGRYTDFTPYLTEESIQGIDDVVIRPLETLVLTAEYDQAIPQKRVVNEIAHYGKRTAVKIDMGASEDFAVHLRKQGRIGYATLRIAFRRPEGSDYRMNASFNGHPLDLLVEDHAYRLEDGGDYASMRKVRIDPKWIRAQNTISVSFSDGLPGTVGSVVLRTAHQ